MKEKSYSVYIMGPVIAYEDVKAKNKKEAIAKCFPDGILNLPGNFYTFEVVEKKGDDSNHATK